MKKHSIVGQLFLATALLLNARLSAQDIPLAPSAAALANDVSKPSVTVSNFLRQFADQTPTGQVSANTVDLLIVDAKLAQGLIGEVMFGTDWGMQKPGLWKSQNARIEGASLRKESGTFFIQGGTIGLWGPPSGNQIQGDKNNLADGFFNFGGAYPGLMGIRAGDTFHMGKITSTVDAVAATGDRGLTGSVAGDSYPSLCHNNHYACGFVGGVNADWQTAFLPGLTVTTQVTRVGNNGGLSNELRSTVGAQYKIKTGPITWIPAAEATHAIHYQAGKSDLNAKIGTLDAEKNLGKNFGLKGYISETRTQGAIAEQFAVGGTALTYHKNGNRLTVDFHNEPLRGQHFGTTVTWLHHFR